MVTRFQPQLAGFIRFIESRTETSFADYPAFEAFTMREYRTFWALFLEWSEIICDGNRDSVCQGDDCETAVFFPTVRLNYAENLLHHALPDNAPALISCYADGTSDKLTRGMLRDRVVRLAGFLQQMGIEPGDRVVAIARNNTEVIITALATAAIGAVFSSCSHDMGAFTILSRLQRLEPKILFANCEARMGDIGTPLPDRVVEVVEGLPSLRAIVTLDIGLDTALPLHKFAEAQAGDPTAFRWQRFPFNHPLFILFSSGTTGAPKCIMHGAGGTLIEHLKEHRLHGDLGSSDCMFFQTSCGWMMWNWQLSALACGAEVVVYDGPLKSPETLWEIVADQQVTVFGTNPAYLQFTAEVGYAPKGLSLTKLRSILSTGSILYPQQFDWIGEQVSADLAVQSISGGTDMIGCFVLGNPLLPVYRGKAQCRSLGLDVRSLPPHEPIGELVCVNPFPSRPIGFFGETNNDRYHSAYFAANPGMWTHGDLIELSSEGAVMHGRSDGVINIRGVRIGPAEIYRILQAIPVIVESMAVEQIDQSQAGGARLILLVVLRGGVPLDSALIVRIRSLLAEQGNPMMVPAKIVQLQELPVTHSGKRSEAAARDAVNGRPITNRTALRNPECLDGLTEQTKPVAADTTAIEGDLEHVLCAICQRHFNVPSVHPTDNFLTLGGDSLTILGFLMDVTRRTKTAIPLQSIIGVSVIQELATLLTNGVATQRKSNGSGSAPEIRIAEQTDEPAICAILDEGFQRKLPWRRIFQHSWQPSDLPRGFVITAERKIVGFLGLIGATRTINGKSGVIGNLTSWYVQPMYRGWSNALIAAATQYDITYTSLTPGRTSRRVLEAMGFIKLDAVKVYSPPLLHAMTLYAGRPRLIFDPEQIRDMVSESERRILDDHKEYNCLPLLVIDGEETAFAIIGRRFYRPLNYQMFRYSQVFYCRGHTLLRRHLERVTLAVMWRQGTVGLSLTEASYSYTGIEVLSSTMFRSNQFAADDLDKLYSELLLLPV